MIFLCGGAKSMQAKQDWDARILFIVCSQHYTICFKRQAVGRSKAALPFVSLSYSIKTEMCYLTLGIWGSLGAFLLTASPEHYLLIYATHFHSLWAMHPSLGVCEYVACDPFPMSLSLHPLLNSVVKAMSALWLVVPHLCLSQLEFLVLTFISIFSSQLSVWFPQA